MGLGHGGVSELILHMEKLRHREVRDTVTKASHELLEGIRFFDFPNPNYAYVQWISLLATKTWFSDRATTCLCKHYGSHLP